MSRSRAILACLGAAVMAAGCGEPAAVVDRDGTLHITLDEYRIQPQTIRVRAGRIHIVARDVGHLTHNLVVQSITDDPKKEIVYGSTDTAHPGDTVSETETLVLKPGRYRLACTIANHENLGQYGTLIVAK